MNAIAMVLPTPLEISSDRPYRCACFASHDGVSLFYRYWPAPQGGSRRAVVLLHRGHEHSGRMEHLVEELGFDDISFFAWDARGHGCSPGERGDSPSFSSAVEDLDCFVRHISERHGIAMEDIAVLAQSVSAVLAASWAHDYAPRIRCMILAAPAFKVKLYVPFARWTLQRLYAWRGNFFINSYVGGRHLTHDPARIASYERDLLISRRISVRMLLGLQDAAERVIADAQAITVPLQVLVAEADWVVHTAPQQDFYARAGSVDKELHSFKGLYHDILGERDRDSAIGKVRSFLARQFAKPRRMTGMTVPLDIDLQRYAC